MREFSFIKEECGTGIDKFFVKEFLNLPGLLYGRKDNMEDPSTVKTILQGTHPLSGYFKLVPFLVKDYGITVGRFSITTYEGDDNAYLGFFECVNDKKVSGYLFDVAYEYCKEQGYKTIVGPVDASFWIKYRLKINRFNVLPYTGEPYNKDYYFDHFKASDYEVCEHYTSNEFRRIDETYVNEKFEKRFEDFTAGGYRIESPKPEKFDKIIDDVYRMISTLYSDFPIYKGVSQEDFKRVFSSYKTIMNMSMTKIAYYEDKAVGFYVSVPDYGNRVYHLNPLNILKILRLKKKPERYVMLYMGVDSAHTGLGKAIVYSIMKELMQSGLPSIGALARDGKVTQKYAFEDVTDVYEYVLLKKEITENSHEQ